MSAPETAIQKFERTIQVQDLAFRMGGLLVYELGEGDVLTVILGNPEDTRGSQNSLFVAELSEQRSGKLRVSHGEYEGSDICIGSYAGSAGIIGFTKPGLLRGFVQKNSFAVIDTAGQHFVGPDSNNLYLPNAYVGLSINDVTFF